MTHTTQVRAIYHAGTFTLREPCNVPEGSEVELIVRDVLVIPPVLTKPTERERILKTVAGRMKTNPIPDAAPALTREALHERV